MPPDFDDRFQQGRLRRRDLRPRRQRQGPVRDAAAVPDRHRGVPGGHLVNFARWKNAEYDKIVDEVYVTPTDDKAKMTDSARKAMEIWLPELPDILLTQFYHRMPMNTTYWTDWPTEENPYVNGAFWHLTYALVLCNLNRRSRRGFRDRSLRGLDGRSPARDPRSEDGAG